VPAQPIAARPTTASEPATTIDVAVCRITTAAAMPASPAATATMPVIRTATVPRGRGACRTSTTVKLIVTARPTTETAHAIHVGPPRTTRRSSFAVASAAMVQPLSSRADVTWSPSTERRRRAAAELAAPGNCSTADSSRNALSTTVDAAITATATIS